MQILVHGDRMIETKIKKVMLIFRFRVISAM